MNDRQFLNPLMPIDRRDGILPHWHQDGVIQFVTFHTADSLPGKLLEHLKREKEAWMTLHPQPWDEAAVTEYHRLFSSRVDKWLDAGHGACMLANRDLAQVVANTLARQNGIAYVLHNYVVMSNHVHVLVEPLGDININDIVRIWKSVSSHGINSMTGMAKAFWHRGWYDRMVRDQNHYKHYHNYIHHNITHGGVLWM